MPHNDEAASSSALPVAAARAAGANGYSFHRGGATTKPKLRGRSGYNFSDKLIDLVLNQMPAAPPGATAVQIRKAIGTYANSTIKNVCRLLVDEGRAAAHGNRVTRHYVRINAPQGPMHAALDPTG